MVAASLNYYWLGPLLAVCSGAMRHEFAKPPTAFPVRRVYLAFQLDNLLQQGSVDLLRLLRLATNIASCCSSFTDTMLDSICKECKKLFRLFNNAHAYAC